jgi:hypothetical protein
MFSAGLDVKFNQKNISYSGKDTVYLYGCDTTKQYDTPVYKYPGIKKNEGGRQDSGIQDRINLGR